MVIDSIASPSGALSGCVKYYMKLTGDTAGTCFNAAPACSVNSGLIGGNTPASSNPATNGGCTWVCATAGQPKFRSIFTSVTLGGVVYRKIVLASGCQFSSSDTTYAVVGNYDFGGTRDVSRDPGRREQRHRPVVRRSRHLPGRRQHRVGRGVLRVADARLHLPGVLLRRVTACSADVPAGPDLRSRA